MPDTPEHPVTLGDLDNLWIVSGDATIKGGFLIAPIGDSRSRPAAVADLVSPEIRPLVVSALRAEGVLVVEKGDGVEIEIESAHPFSLECGSLPWRSLKAGRYLLVALDALAEAQPFPPAGI